MVDSWFVTRPISSDRPLRPGKSCLIRLSLKLVVPSYQLTNQRLPPGRIRLRRCLQHEGLQSRWWRNVWGTKVGGGGAYDRDFRCRPVVFFFRPALPRGKMILPRIHRIPRHRPRGAFASWPGNSAEARAKLKLIFSFPFKTPTAQSTPTCPCVLELHGEFTGRETKNRSGTTQQSPERTPPTANMAGNSLEDATKWWKSSRTAVEHSRGPKVCEPTSSSALLCNRFLPR